MGTLPCRGHLKYLWIQKWLTRSSDLPTTSWSPTFTKFKPQNLYLKTGCYNLRHFALYDLIASKTKIFEAMSRKSSTTKFSEYVDNLVYVDKIVLSGNCISEINKVKKIEIKVSN